MKLTKNKLRQIIKEEASQLDEFLGLGNVKGNELVRMLQDVDPEVKAVMRQINPGNKIGNMLGKLAEKYGAKAVEAMVSDELTSGWGWETGGVPPYTDLTKQIMQKYKAGPKNIYGK